MENIPMKPMPLENHTKHNIILSRRSLISSIRPIKKKKKKLKLIQLMKKVMEF